MLPVQYGGVPYMHACVVHADLIDGVHLYMLACSYISKKGVCEWAAVDIR